MTEPEREPATTEIRRVAGGLTLVLGGLFTPIVVLLVWLLIGLGLQEWFHASQGPGLQVLLLAELALGVIGFVLIAKRRHLAFAIPLVLASAGWMLLIGTCFQWSGWH